MWPKWDNRSCRSFSMRGTVLVDIGQAVFLHTVLCQKNTRHIRYVLSFESTKHVCRGVRRGGGLRRLKPPSPNLDPGDF